MVKVRLLTKITPRLRAESVGEMLVEQKVIEFEMIFFALLRIAYKKIFSFGRMNEETIRSKPGVNRIKSCGQKR